MFLKHRMRAFQGTFHANPDYALWYGWSEMRRDLTDIKEMADALRHEKSHAHDDARRHSEGPEPVPGPKNHRHREQKILRRAAGDGSSAGRAPPGDAARHLGITSSWPG